ncbi:MAG: phosphatidylglycerol lysyltransferase domain-containing protein [Synergistes sp.]|nr:phosphatidylglycerol lysyltransferase domain-containing protein [Synergistes sp.]
MDLQFRELTLSDAEHYIERWNKCGQAIAAYSFSSVWSWAADFGTEVVYDEDADLYWIRQSNNKLKNLAPVGDWKRNDWADVLRKYAGNEIEMYLVPEVLVRMWCKALSGTAEINATEDRGAWEYVYDIRALASLAGRKYMKKRNHVNKFKRDVSYIYEPITVNNLNEILEFQESWYRTNAIHNSVTLAQENRSVRNVLSNWDRIPNRCGGALRANGRIIAYTTGETVGDCLIVHYEKASHEYADGAAYQVINQEFLRHTLEQLPDLKRVNREEDLNEPGLRAAKMSYMPDDFIKLYSVKIKFGSAARIY